MFAERTTTMVQIRFWCVSRRLWGHDSRLGGELKRKFWPFWRKGVGGKGVERFMVGCGLLGREWRWMVRATE